MNKFIILIALVFFYFDSISYANDNCKDFKKFSTEYFKCKGNQLKNKTISAGKNIIKDTKDYQNKEWTKEKEKLNKTKEKINKTKEKILN